MSAFILCRKDIGPMLQEDQVGAARRSVNTLNGPHYGAWRLDPADPASWSHLRLRYSDHALERASLRSIPELTFLPPTSRLADLDKTDERVEAMLFKVTEGVEPFFVVLSTDGCVITVFRKGREWDDYRSAKKRRRARLTAV